MKGRWLIHHPESDCLFEVFSSGELLNNLRDGHCDDVTDVEKFELQFKKSLGMSPSNRPKGKKGKSNMGKQDLLAAHVNGLRSSIHALEVQVTIVKQLLKGEGVETEENDDNDDEQETKPAKKGKGKKAAAKSFDDDDDADGGNDDGDADDSDDEEKPAKKGKSKSKSFDDDDDSDSDSGSEEEPEENDDDEKPAKKKGKGKKLTVDDVNDACMERAGNTNRAEVLGLLKKHFKVKSVTDLKPEDYEACIKLMKKG